MSAAMGRPLATLLPKIPSLPATKSRENFVASHATEGAPKRVNHSLQNSLNVFILPDFCAVGHNNHKSLLAHRPHGGARANRCVGVGHACNTHVLTQTNGAFVFPNAYTEKWNRPVKFLDALDRKPNVPHVSTRLSIALVRYKHAVLQSCSWTSNASSLSPRSPARCSARS